jgi:dTDP-4-dehydrorhamnose reductase
VLENDLEHMKVVNNQEGSPTSATDVARFLNHLIGNDPEQYGTYHFSNKGSMTWHAFAKAILEEASLHKDLSPTDEFPTLAKRPVYSVMDCAGTEEVFSYQIDSQEVALAAVYKDYLTQQ